MDIFDILASIIVDEPNSNIGYILNNDEVIQELSKNNDLNFMNLANYNLTEKSEFIGEFFKNLILVIDLNLLNNKDFLMEITKIIQKDRLLILITNLDIFIIKKLLEPFHWTDFSEIITNNKKKVFIRKKWFQI